MIKKFEFVECHAKRMPVKIDKPWTLPLLWNYKGMYVLVPRASLNNLHSFYKDECKVLAKPSISANITFVDYGKVPAGIARLLLDS